MTLRFTILGCGSSPGVPRIGNIWGACDPKEPRNYRKRCSLLIEKIGKAGKTIIIIDTGPDLRQQCLDADIDWADGVLYTHGHADHVHGIDDLRSFVINHKRRVSVYADQQTINRLREGFGYCFEMPPGSSYPPILDAHLIEPGRVVTITGDGGSIEILPVKQIHGDIESLGFRIGNFAYSSDISALPDESADMLQGLDYWVVDALRYTPHPSHFSVSEALAEIKRVGPKRAVLTHMHIDLDYRKLKAELPTHIVPAYDGWVLEM